MDPSFSGFPDFTNENRVTDQAVSTHSNYNPNLVNMVDFNVPSPDFGLLENPFLPPDLPAAEPYAPSPAAESLSPPSSEDSEYSETVLKFMNQILMEENIDDKPSLFFDPLGLEITEKSFYDALGQRYPPSPNQYQPPVLINLNVESPDDVFFGSSGDYGTNSSFTTRSSSTNQYQPPVLINRNVESPGDVFSGSSGDYGTNSSSTTRSSSTDASISQATHPADYVLQPNLQSNSGSQFLANPSNDVNDNIGDGMELLAQNIFTDTESMLQFRRGLEEASKFLPRGNQLVIDLESSMVLSELKGEDRKVDTGVRENPLDGSRGRKNHEREDIDLEEGRSNKQSAVCVEESELSEMFDNVLLLKNSLYTLCSNNESGKNEASKASWTNEQPQGANGGKSRGKKQGKTMDTVDLRTLLILCAQSVSTGDNTTANELLRQIRQHSSPFGDGSQRVAHFFANGLQARLDGTQVFYTPLSSKKISAYEILNAFQVHLSACPFKRMSIFFANKAIYKLSEKATSLHIIDFGTGYGFQWPILIHKLSKRSGGPPKLRITGIEFPQPGFRPTERIEETGRRLAKYCKRFNVPFEYHAMASSNWETIQIEDLKIDRNEMLAVNCLYRFKNLLDETVEETSPRNAVLNLIRRMNPDIFVHSIVNGGYDAPFFLTRFREALFFFSALFDTFDVTIPRDNPERLMFEREFYGREAMNVIACEGLARVERPEPYKQWQVRTVRAGFRQLPLDQDLMNIFRSKMKEWYHKDFVFDEDSRWMLLGWKGRIINASSCWVPA